MTFWWADAVLALAGMATTAVRQAAAKAKLAETLRIMTITCELGAVINVCGGVSVPHKFRDRCTEPDVRERLSWAARRLAIRAYGLRRGDRSARAVEREIRVLDPLGRRPAVGARALSDREIREKAGHRDQLPEGDQS